MPYKYLMRKEKTGHGVGKGSVSISTSVDEKTMEQIDALAAKSGLTRGGWARAALTEAAEDSACYTKTTKRTNPAQGKASPQDTAQNVIAPSASLDIGSSTATHPSSRQAG
jgi:hypothetical protein